jgi:hypothetical protein
MKIMIYNLTMNFSIGIIIIYAKLLYPWTINVEIVANSTIKTNVKQCD